MTRSNPRNSAPLIPLGPKRGSGPPDPLDLPPGLPFRIFLRSPPPPDPFLHHLTRSREETRCHGHVPGGSRDRPPLMAGVRKGGIFPPLAGKGRAGNQGMESTSNGMEGQLVGNVCRSGGRITQTQSGGRTDRDNLIKVPAVGTRLKDQNNLKQFPLPVLIQNNARVVNSMNKPCNPGKTRPRFESRPSCV